MPNWIRCTGGFGPVFIDADKIITMTRDGELTFLTFTGDSSRVPVEETPERIMESIGARVAAPAKR